jgi:hypothetical protein
MHWDISGVILTVFFSFSSLCFAMTMATEQPYSKCHLGLSVHRVFWNMQWDMLGVILMANLSFLEIGWC